MTDNRTTADLLQEIVRGRPEIERLQAQVSDLIFALVEQQAAEIERLKADCRDLKAALAPFAEYAVEVIRHVDGRCEMWLPDNSRQPMFADFDAARAALSAGKQ